MKPLILADLIYFSLFIFSMSQNQDD